MGEQEDKLAAFEQAVRMYTALLPILQEGRVGQMQGFGQMLQPINDMLTRAGGQPIPLPQGGPWNVEGFGQPGAEPTPQGMAPPVPGVGPTPPVPMAPQGVPRIPIPPQPGSASYIQGGLTPPPGTPPPPLPADWTGPPPARKRVGFTLPPPLSKEERGVTSPPNDG